MATWRKRFTAWLIRRRAHIYGAEILSTTTGGWLAVANHDHRLDWLLMAPFLPDGCRFALHPGEMPPAWLRAWCHWLVFMPLDPLEPEQLKPLARHLKEGGRVALFPTGGGFGDGAVGRIHAGLARLPELAGVPVIGLWIDHTAWWRVKGYRPSPNLTIMPPRHLDPGHGSDRTRAAELALATLLEEAALNARGHPATPWQGLVHMAETLGRAFPILADSTGARLDYGGVLFRARLLGRLLAEWTQPGERVGVLLPTSAGSLVVLFALFAIGRVPALLNFTVGPGAARSACRTAHIRLVLTSRRFVDKANLAPLVAELANETTVRHLEDLAGAARRPWNLLRAWLASFSRSCPPVHPHDEAVILFTSGTEGEPKGVALSHAALMANIRQVQVRVGLLSAPGQDLMLDVLPLFHAFGLTVAGLAPLLSGFKLHMHPSPLDYRAIAEMAQRLRPTLLVGTDTFLAGYGRVAHPGDFQSLRRVFAGGEPLRERTRHLWLEKFGVPVYQGYGATECAPAIAVDTPLLKGDSGCVGLPLPGVSIRLEPVAGVHEGGRLLVSGPNLMLGHIPSRGDGRVVPVHASGPGAGWHDVGDVVTVDAHGFIRIVGRLKRFAKIGGEMVSLAAVESLAEIAWPDHRHAAVSLSDSRKGERIVLATEYPTPDRDTLIAVAKREGMSALFVPGRIEHMETIPQLGPGKMDYQTVIRFMETGL
ncbi:Bifunctional protein Aas [Candidatus Magnetaquicoccaceae bacterium FCR-1]|uniref:Bifunctional protein Aas n=1 Tax=Candidatus Magnetaquiglobus chichijimensis TaxID=3141448 RepID=A0ABQ0C602_9PROT